MVAILKPKDDDFDPANSMSVESVENGYIATFFYEDSGEEIKYIFSNKTDLVAKILEVM